MNASMAAPLLVSGSCDASVCVINYESGKVLQKMTGHGDSVESVRFQKGGQGRFASSASLDGNVKVWDLNVGKERSELRHGDSVVVHEWCGEWLVVSGCM